MADLGAGTSAAVLEDMAFAETWFALCPRLANIVDIVIRGTASPDAPVQIATEALERELSQPSPDTEDATEAPEEASPRSLLGIDIHDLELSPVRSPNRAHTHLSTPRPSCKRAQVSGCQVDLQHAHVEPSLLAAPPEHKPDPDVRQARSVQLNGAQHDTGQFGCRILCTASLTPWPQAAAAAPTHVAYTERTGPRLMLWRAQALLAEAAACRGRCWSHLHKPPLPQLHPT